MQSKGGMKMSGKTIITFKPTNGVYKDTIKPYRSWYDASDMSSLLEINGRKFRVIRIVGPFQKKYAKKILVCRENGQIEENEEIVRKCFTIYLYLASFVINESNMAFDATQAGTNRHEPLIEAFTTMTEELKPELTVEQVQAMEFHLYYLKEIYRLSVLIANEVEFLMQCKSQLENLPGENLPTSLIDKLIRHSQTWVGLRSELEAMLFEDGERARDTVWDILRNSDYKGMLSSTKYVQHVLREIHGAKMNAQKEIRKAKEEKKKYGETDLFTVEKHIYALRNEMTLERSIQRNLEIVIKELWVLSPAVV